MDRSALDRALLDAHAAGDASALIQLYTLAADRAETRDDDDAACFYLTHAFVFALEAAAPQAPVLNTRLAQKGRSHPMTF